MSTEEIDDKIRQGLSSSQIAREYIARNPGANFGNIRKNIGFYRSLKKSGEKPNSGSLEEDFSTGQAKEIFTVDNPPTTLEDALKNSHADLSKWEVQKWTWNHWAGRYQVKVQFSRKEIKEKDRVESLLSEVRDSFKTIKTKKVKGSGVGVVSLADFHYGMKFNGDAKNRPFNIETLTHTISRVIEEVNALGLEEVHLTLLGDFVESFTGVNHANTWKNLESYGRSALTGVARLICEQLVAKINNVAHIYIVPGNHDRVTVKSDLDSIGEGAGIIADLMELMIDVPISFDYLFLNPEIDGVKYILSHGNLGLSKRDEYATILEYGDQNLYNVILQGHYHSRDVKKGYKMVKNKVTNTVTIEGSNFRKITVPPLVTGGAYSSSLGRFSTSGATVIWNNGSGGINHLDCSI